MRLQLDADTYGVEFNDALPAPEPRRHGHGHRLRRRGGARRARRRRLRARRDDRGPGDLAGAGAEPREAGVRQEKRADAAALDEQVDDHLARRTRSSILRVDYFENYAGRFLSVEAKTRDGGVDADGRDLHRADAVAVLEHAAPARRSTPPPRAMSVNIDPDTTPDTYIEHRELVRIGDAGHHDPPAADADPHRLEHRRGRSRRRSQTWLGGGLPPMADALPEGLHDPLHGPDRGLRALRRAGGRVPEHRRADHAAEQDERLPAARAGEHGRHDRIRATHVAARPRRRRRSCSPRAPGATRAATTSRPSSSTRARPNSPLDRDGHRQRHHRLPRRRTRRARCRARPRRSSRRSTPTRRRARSSWRSPTAANAGAGIVAAARRRSTCPTSSTTATNAHVQRGPFEYSVHADRQAARRHEGRRLPLLPAARPRVGDAADVPRDRRAAAAQLRDRPSDARSSSTTSTSSSCRRRTPTARTTRCTTSGSSGAT